jgi:integrase
MTVKRRERVEPGIYRRADGRLEIGCRDATGRLRWQVVAGGIVAARNQLAIAKAQRAQGVRPAADPRLSFDAAADAWLEARVSRLRPASQNAYGVQVRHLRDRFGATRLSAISTNDVARLVADMERNGVAGNTQRNRLTALSGIIRYAVRHLGHDHNPVAALDRVERPKVTDGRPRRVLDDAELSALIASALDHHRLLIAIAGQTGARKGEVLGIAWGDVDTARRTITIDRQLNRQGVRVPTKTPRSRRTIAITPGLIAALNEHRLASGRPASSELVLHRADGRPYSHDAADEALRSAVRRAGIAPAPSFHDLRHTHASRLLAAGRDPAYVAARLGDTVAMVLSTYAHAMPRRADEADELAALYDHGNAVETADGSPTPQKATAAAPNTASLRAIGNASR